MNNRINFQNHEYEVLKNIFIDNTEIAVCINEDRTNIIYLKVNYIGERASYVTLKNLIKVLPDYQNIASANKEKILNAFVEVLNNILAEMKFLNLSSLIETIENFEDYIRKNEIYYYTTKNCNVEITDIIINKLKKYLHKYNDNVNDITKESNSFIKTLKKIKLFINGILNNKFCGAYTIMVIVSAVGMMICFSEYSSWKESGSETGTIMDDILTSTTIDYGEEENQRINEILSNQSNPNDQPITESEANQKYGSDYWTYKRVSMLSVDFSELLTKNFDTVGWLYVSNTNINYPVVQTDNNDYYLTHSFDGSTNVAGWIFADYRSDMENFKRNTVIYGHGRTDQVMFGSLNTVLTPEWHTNEVNQYIKLSTPTKNVVWQIVSVYTIRAESYYLTHNFENDEAYRAYLNTILGRSIYNFNVPVATTDKILTLSTCLNTTGDRIVVHAKMIRVEDRQ